MDGAMKSLFVFAALLLASCASTVDVERAARSMSGIGKQADPSLAIAAVPIEVDPQIIVVEKPIYIPQGAPAPAAQQGRAAVSAAIGAIVAPQDYSNSAMLYDYDRDFVYELYCQPFRVSDITLQPNEKLIEAPFISDSERWMLGAGVSYENGASVQHVYVKPTVRDLVGTLIINTDLRVYHLIIRSFSDIHMPIVRWRYSKNDMPQNYSSAASLAPSGIPAAASPGAALADDDPSYFVDPRFVSFNYKITYGIFRKPKWLPTLVYDDGRKTYITFPQSALTMELPTIFENRTEIVNYHVYQNVMIIDKLIEKITIKLSDKIATVEKKKGK
jgi:type IV secretion system protein VirB9